MSISQSNFEFVAKLTYDKSAIVVSEGKEYLVENRLIPLARSEGHEDLDTFLTKIRSNGVNARLSNLIIDALTTNETYFFRDVHPFVALEKSVLPDLIEKRRTQRRLTIWSAACSSGQETYSIAMILHKHFPEIHSWDVQIVATDISPTVLEKAKTGLFSQLEVNRGLPAPYLVQYFQKIGSDWVVDDKLKKMIDFRLFNLCDPFLSLIPFDIIFIRNVLIYFDMDTKRRILANMKKKLRDQGVLFLGTAETTSTVDPGWVPVKLGNSIVYQKAG